MKKTLLLKTLLLLCAFIVGSSSVKAQDYTKVMECDLTGMTYGTSNYNASTAYGDWTIVNGANNNKKWAYFKMGGKNTTLADNNPCYIYSTKATTDRVDKITVHLPEGSLSSNKMSVNSWGVYVYSDEEMETQIDYVAGGTITNSEGSFDFTPSTGKTWASGYYYKVSWDLANTSTSNGIICVDKITLYKESGPAKTATTTTIDDTDLTNTDVYVGTAAGALSAAVTVKEGGAAVAGATVSWDSSDKNVATIDENGAVTLVAVGTTTITATYNGNDTYGSSKDTYELTVTSSQPKQPYYLVTDASQLADGDKIIIVSGTKALSTTQNSGNRSATDVTKEADGSFLLDVDAEVQVLTLEKTTITIENVTTDVWYLQTTGDNYLYASSNSSNQLKTAKKKTAGDNGKAAITFSNEDASIIFQGDNGRNDIRYNPNNGNPIFSCYATSSTMDAVQIYKATATITIDPACKEGEKYYATYSSAKPFVVPNDITVSSVAVDGEGNLVITDYTQGETVPANYGVLVSAATAGEKKVYYSNDAGTGHADQMLYASSEGLTAAQMATAAPNCEYYRLTMHNGTIIGFWWGAEDGASFAIAANKAYLAVPKGTSAKAGFAFNENVANGINALDTQHPTPNTQHPIYNLAGQRVNKSYKGVVIVNGKKMLNK